MLNKILPSLLLLSTAGCLLGIEPWGEEARFTNFSSEEPAGDEQRIEAEVRLSVGRLEIEAGDPAKAYELDLYYNDAAFKPLVEFKRSDEGTGHLRFELGGEGKSARRIGKTRLTLGLNPRVPLGLRAETGVAESRIDLTGISLESLELEAGVGETTVSALTANPVACRKIHLRSGVGALNFTGLGNLGAEKIVFEGGVGAASLDFSGSWTDESEVELRVGVGGLEIRLPRDLGVELRITKSFLSGVSISGFRQDGNTYYSDNFERAAKKIRIRVQAGIGGVEVNWI